MAQAEPPLSRRAGIFSCAPSVYRCRRDGGLPRDHCGNRTARLRLRRPKTRGSGDAVRGSAA